MQVEGAHLRDEHDAAKARQQELADERESLIEERAKAGGDRIGELERLAREARAQADKRRHARTRFDAALSAAGLEPIVDGVGFASLTALVTAERPRLAAEKRSLDTASADAIGREKELVGRLPWLTDTEVIYWGDIDTHGFAILDRLRAWLPWVRSALMDRETLMVHRDRWVTEDRPTRSSLTRLTRDEQALYRIDWSWAEERLEAKPPS